MRLIYVCVLLACCGCAVSAEETKPEAGPKPPPRFQFFKIGLLDENQYGNSPHYNVFLLRDSSTKTEYIIVPKGGVCQIHKPLDSQKPEE